MVGFNFQVDDRPSPLSNSQNPPICVGSTQFKTAKNWGTGKQSLLDQLF